MTSGLHISTSLSLPLSAVTSTFALLSVRGAGKSNAGAAMAEEMFKAGLPFVAVDPVGSWAGLRSGQDGTPKGGLAIPIFGGKFGDVPLERGSGQLVADLIVDKRLSCVVDLSKFASEGDKKSFLLAFAQRLYQRNEDPLHLFLEEADDYIPQKPMRDEAQLLRAWENIVRRGRARGLGITLITQRSAAISKMVLTQVETLFVLRTTGPQDIAAIEAWVKYHQVDAKLLASLAGLEDGEAWVWSPHYLHKFERFRFRMRATFDTGATPKNVRGKDVRKAATLADVDLTAIREQMAATIEKAKADDPRELRKRILELEKQLKAKIVPVVNKVGKTERVEVKVPFIPDKQLRRIESLGNKLSGLSSRADDLSAQMKQSTEELLRISAANVVKTVPTGQRLLASTPRAALVKSPPQPASRPIKAPPVSNGAGLPAGERAVLIAVAQTPSGATREQVSILTGYRKSTRNAYLYRLGAAGLVEQEGEVQTVTEQGLAALGSDFEPLPTGDALREHWLQNLPDGERKVFEAIVGAYPEAIDRESITEQTGYVKSTRNAYISRLNVRKIISIARDGVTAAKELFN